MTDAHLEIDKLRADIANRMHYLRENNSIEPELYSKYNIKRGLRNDNGTGVLVGITRISDVRGYTIEDGKKIPCEGKLLYRGIPIYDLMRGFEREHRHGFEEIVYLLLFGLLPNRTELDHFSKILQHRRKLPESFKEDIILKIPSRNLMNKLQRTILSLYSYDEDPDNIELGNVLAQCIDLIAKMPLMLAYAFATKEHYFNHKSLIMHQPLENGSTAENILHLIRPDSQFTPLEANILDLCLCLQADHGGGNNSAFATHVVSSSGTDTYSAISTAIGSLKGPRHGAANQRAHAMVKDIQSHVKHWDNDGEIADYLKRILAGDAFDGSGLIYGMGHAVYTLSDPRAVLLREKSALLAKETGFEAQFDLIERITHVTKELMREKKGDDFNICPNIDLYTGLIYEMMGIESDLFTPLFATARIAGWSAHRLEQIMDSKIMRPGYFYLDANDLTYAPLDER
ncbi:MAG: citrate synthase [Peptococcaceae bacterium]|nr:citrate synthase [Peptococcaceae bacterium]